MASSLHPLVEMFKYASPERRREYVEKRLAGPMPDDVFDFAVKDIRRVCEREMSRPLPPPISPIPTQLEFDALTLAAEELTNEEIAAKLGCSVVSVNRRLNRVYQRFGVKGRVGAVRVACERGYLGIGIGLPTTECEHHGNDGS